MKLLIRSIPLLAVLALAGCSSSPVRPVSNAIPSGRGVEGGSGPSQGMFHLKTKSEQRAYQSGYQEALSDQIKDEYWRLQFRHRPDPSNSLSVPVLLPERVTPDGVRLVPSTEYIKIHQ